MTAFQRRLRRFRRGVLVGLGLFMIPVGIVGVLVPMTGHVLGGLMIVGLILVLRNSPHWRRRFVKLQRRHPRYVYPVRRVLRGEVAPVLWHAFLSTERWLLPRSWRRLRRWRRAAKKAFGRRWAPA